MAMLGRSQKWIMVSVLLVLVMLLTGGLEARTVLRWATIAGFYTDWAAELVKEFEQKTGIEVEIVQMDLATMYEKEAIEMAGRTGAYDIITVESTWLAEWAHAGWLEPLDSYIAETPKSEFDISDVAPALVRISCTYKDKIYALPYYTFTAGMFYRKDLFDDPGERAAFKAKYGYDLDVPKTWEQHRDIAEFFTRKAGQTLKGEVLKHDFYGVGMMAGRFDEIQDEWMAILWAMGGEVMDKDMNVVVNSPIGVKATQFYIDMLKFAPPGALTSSYDEVIAQLQQGMIAMTMGMFLDQWANAVKTEQNIPGAVIACAPAPGYTAFIGCFSVAISRDSKNKKEAWEFIKFLAGPETQRKFALGGGTTALMSVLLDPEIQKHRDVAGHYPVLAEILKYHAEHNIEHPWLQSPAAGKIYREMSVCLCAAVAGEMTPEEAMNTLAERIRLYHSQAIQEQKQ